MNYRRSIYRKNRIKAVVITSAISLVVIALAFVIIGNAIGANVEENVAKRASKATQTNSEPHAQARSVMAFPVALSDDSSSLSSRLSKIANDGYTEVCFDLDTAEGALLYSSELAISLGKQSVGTELLKLDDAAKKFKDMELYSIGVTRVPDLLSDDDLLRASASGYYAALIAEALRNGIDDVLIHASSVPTDRYGELITLANEIKRLCPDSGSIGVSLPVGVLSDSGNSELIDSLWGAFDYLAADLTSVAAEGDSVPDAVDRALGDMLYYLLRYNVRVLVPYSSDTAEFTAISQSVESNGSQNLQFMKQ